MFNRVENVDNVEGARPTRPTCPTRPGCPVPTVAPRSLPTVANPARIVRTNRVASRFGHLPG